MIQLLSLLSHLFLLTIVYIIGWIVTYLLYIIQFIFLKIEAKRGEITSQKALKIFKEVNYFYSQIMPTFFFNIYKERLLTLHGIENLYSKLPIILRILFAIIFTLFIIYCILLLTSYLYYCIILQ